jgi:hypothetical protein
MPTIELSNRTFERLQSLAKPFIDTPETVIARLLDREAQDGSIPAPSSQTPLRAPSTQSTQVRARRGETSPESLFFEPIVAVLKRAGGALPTQEVVDQVGSLIEDELTPLDLEPISSGELRWRNTCRWARKRLVEQGVLDRLAPRGTWRLKRQ